MRTLRHSTRGGVHAVVVEPVWVRDGLAVIQVGTLWNVSHTSGFAVLHSIIDQHIAIHSAEALLALGDWQRPMLEVQADERLRRIRDGLFLRLDRAGALHRRK